LLSPHECLRARSDIIAITPLQDNKIIFSTKHHGVKIFSTENCNVLKNISIDLLGYQTTAVAFSPDNTLVSFANETIIYILNLDNKTIIQTIRTSDGNINILSFVPNSPYLIAGTDSGRVMKYRYDGRAQLSRLCSFPYLTGKRRIRVKNNYVSALAFHGLYLACSGYGGAITLLKLNSLANKVTIEASKVRINALCFLDNETLVSGNVDGTVQFHSLKKHKPVKNIATPFTNIKNIIIMPNSRHLMVSGDSNKLIIIDTELTKIVSNNYLTFSHKIRHILLDGNNNLLVALENDELLKIILPSVENLKSHILHNSLDKAFELLERDPMLRGTREHKRVEVMYENLYMQAVNALINSNTKEAHKLTEMLKNIPGKKEDINSIFTAFKHYNRFKTLYLEKKYALGYAMCEKYPALKRTHQFKKMEENFKEAFTFAQKQVLIGREDIAREILSPYTTAISKKAIINLVLNQNKDFMIFLKAIQNKEHTVVEKLLKTNEVFAQIPTYIALQNSTQVSLTNIENLIIDAKIEEAIEEIKRLQSRPEIKAELQELYRTCKVVKMLQKSYEENNFKLCYELIDSNHNLDELQLTKMLEKHWSKLISQSEEFALKGDIKSIKHTLKELIKVETRVDKIGDLLRVSFHTKIKALLAKRNFKNAENIIYSYIDIFGIDSELNFLMKSYEKMATVKLAITLTQEKFVPRNNWLNSPLIMNS
jgi:hypothetical protein